MYIYIILYQYRWTLGLKSLCGHDDGSTVGYHGSVCWDQKNGGPLSLGGFKLEPYYGPFFLRLRGHEVPIWPGKGYHNEGVQR